MHKITGTLFIASMTLVMTACIPTKVTGGGQIDRTAVFGFNADSCDGEINGRFNLNDISAGVQLRGTVIDALECPSIGCICGDDELQVNATYEPKKRSAGPGGVLVACLVDDGEGQGAMDHARIAIFGGVYDGYTIEGEVTGNVQEHGCD